MSAGFTPKPWEPGARIEWTHFYPDGNSIRRSGVVWDRGPTVDGTTMVAWVTPDKPLPSDLYRAIAVGKSSKRHNPVHGTYWLDNTATSAVGRGEVFSSNYAGSPLGVLAVTAARRAHETRQSKSVAA